MLGKISLVLPVYNEVAILQQVLDKYLVDLDNCGHDFEVIAINDGSTDGTEDVLLKYSRLRRNFRVITLDGRCGKQSAITCGMEQCDPSSSATILADIDILNPLGIIARVITELEGGKNILYAKRENFGFDNIRAWGSDLTVKLGAKLFGIDGFYTGKANIAAYTRPVVDVLTALPEKNKFLRTMDNWLGWRVEYIKYASGYNKIEERNILAASMARAQSAPMVKSHKPLTRDTIREHTPSLDLFWGMFTAALVLFLTALFLQTAGAGIDFWMLLSMWLGCAFFALLAALFFIRATLIKRIGNLNTHEIALYKIKSVVN